MPTVLREKGCRCFFFSLENREPPHIHVAKGEGYAKYWLDPVELVRSRGFRGHELTEIRRIVVANRELFEEAWNEHFSRSG